MKDQLFDSVEKGRVDILNTLINDGEDINVFDKYGDPVLILALHQKQREVIQYLLNLKKLNVNLCDAKGQTALHHVAYHGLYNEAKVVLDRGGDLSIQDVYGNQPLWTAVFNVKKDLRGLDIVELYLNAGASRTHKNKAGRSPLDFVEQVKFDPLLKLFGKYS